jgi:hypothetical protein
MAADDRERDSESKVPKGTCFSFLIGREIAAEPLDTFAGLRF